jgi:hypothetical protein
MYSYFYITYVLQARNVILNVPSIDGEATGSFNEAKLEYIDTTTLQGVKVS